MQDFIAALWGDTAGLIELRLFSDDKSQRDAKPVQRWTTPDKLEALVPKVAEWCLRRRYGAFVGVLPRKSKGGKAEDTAAAALVWCDLDFKDYEGGEEEARATLSAFHQPTAIVRSGNGLHAYWRLKKPHEPKHLSRACRQLAGHLGGDMASTDPARVLRLPGTFNAKEANNPKAVEIESIDAAVVYYLEDLTEGLALPRAPIQGPNKIEAIKYKELSPKLKKQIHDDETLSALLEGKGKPTAGPQGEALDTSTAGYDWSFLRELVWNHIDDPAQLAGALAYKVQLDEKRVGKPSSRGKRYISRTVRRVIASNPPRKTGGSTPAAVAAKDKGKPKAKRAKRPHPRGGAEAAVWNVLEMGRYAPSNCSSNLHKILTMDSRQKGRIWYDEFRELPCYDKERLTDIVETQILLWIEQTYGILTISMPRLRAVIDMVAAGNKRHAVREWLRKLEWDQQPRLNDWLQVYLGAQAEGEDIGARDAHEQLLGAMGQKFLVSCVARAFRPGCKVDTMLILVGPQGAYKSSAFRVLAGEDWFSDSDIDLKSKDKYQVLSGSWLHEIAELSSFSRADQISIKAYVSSSKDKFRPTHGHRTVERARQVVFVGTTNEAEFLSDRTGSRRFWPVVVGDIDLEALKEDREQLWAEAVAFFEGGESWWLESGHDELREEMAEPYRRQDPWERSLEEFIQKQDAEYGSERLFHIDEALAHLGKDLDKATKADQMRLAGMLKASGCTKVRGYFGHKKRQTKWSPPEP